MGNVQIPWEKHPNTESQNKQLEGKINYLKLIKNQIRSYGKYHPVNEIIPDNNLYPMI